MFARTTIVRGAPTAVEAGIEQVRDRVWPTLQGMSGCVGMSMLADRDAGRCIVTSAWADETAMHASAEAVKESRRQAAEVMRADSVEVGEWRIAVLHRTHPSGDGAATRVIWSDLTMGTADGMVDRFRMGVMSQLEDLPGFCSVSLLVDLAGRHAVTAVTYESRDALRRASERASAMRDEFTRSAGTTITEVAEFDLVLAHLRVPEMA
ncbi:antibiotic biosynthesis monooxygenase [Modestobacter sp. NPDC049651]|uniref:antibiotic biosynthesis monooxygenase n=1 Tax=unclassified Modestobacter TaxID=2643866 RepID=UPI0033EF2A0D